MLVLVWEAFKKCWRPLCSSLYAHTLNMFVTRTWLTATLLECLVHLLCPCIRDWGRGRGGWEGGEGFLSHWWRQLIPGVCVPTNKYSPLLHLLWWALWCWIVRFFVSLSLCKTSVAIEWMWRHARLICCRHTRRYRTFSSSAIALVLGCGILRNFAVCFWDVHILHFTLEFV